MAALGLQEFESQGPVFPRMIPDGRREDALVVIAMAGASSRQAQLMELRVTLWQFFTLAEVQVGRMEAELAGPFLPEQ